MDSKGIYIYGIIPNFYSTEMFRTLDSLGLYSINFNNVSAIVSEWEGTTIDYSDRVSLGHLLINHQKTIENLQNIGFKILIPMRFCTIVGSKEEVFKIFTKGFDLITETLKKIQFQSEIDLAITWADFPALLKNISDHPDVVAMKENIIKNFNILSQGEQMRAGMMVQAKLKEKNLQVESRIIEFLSSVSQDIKKHEVMNDEMITNSAFLLKRTNIEKFEQMIDQLDEEFTGSLNFKIVGPLPCYSFYTIEVKELNQEQIEQAANTLGLNGETSDIEIKKAYLEKAKIYHPDNSSGSGDINSFKMIQNALNILQDYSLAAGNSVKEEPLSLSKEKISENLILVKIKD